MSSSPIRESHPGVIRGQSYESKCWVEMAYATAHGVPPAVVQFRIVSLAKAPPAEGLYKLYVDGDVLEVKYAHGAWYSGQ